jgi:hypothetical protein
MLISFAQITLFFPKSKDFSRPPCSNTRLSPLKSSEKRPVRPVEIACADEELDQMNGFLLFSRKAPSLSLSQPIIPKHP